MDDKSETDGTDPELTRSDINLIGRAARQDWGLSPDVQTRLLKQLVAICDPETDEGQRASQRTKISAMKAIAALMKLQLGQQALDLAREKYDGGKDQLGLIDLVGPAEERAERRKRERGE